MFLLVSVSDDDDETANNIGLTRDRVQFAVESRLRGARLFGSAPGLPILEVSVGVMGSAFNLNMFYNKMIFDSVSGRNDFAVTWRRWMLGTHGWDADDIVSSLSQLLDRFLTEYLRVNEAACTGSPQPPNQ